MTLFNYYKSELINRGLNEFVNAQGDLIFFKKEKQFMTKILTYDEDIQEITNDLFGDLKIEGASNDYHFKKMFLFRFINRQINRQTIESFQLQIMTTFLSNQHFIQRIYEDIEKFMVSENRSQQTNQQKSDGNTITDNRSATSELPQSNVQLDVDSSIMETANDNSISKNKQRNQSQSDGETISENQSYQIDQLLKANGLMDMIMDKFDRACFIQIW